MKQQINIEGMSCGGCVKAVEKALGQTEGVNSVSVSLISPQASIETNHTISDEQLQNALTKAGSYRLAGNEMKEKPKSSSGSCCG
jgi:copper chaperone CopZ